MRALAITVVPAIHARPYSRLARIYDAAIGRASFQRTRMGFERIVCDFGLRFRSAADLGCGTGLFACYLARRWGVPVLAIDRSVAMLRIAACNCRSPRVRLLRQDIRRLRLPWRVDLATANFDTLNHLPTMCDLTIALRRIANNLKPGGWLIIDVVTPCRPLGNRLRRRLETASRRVSQLIRWNPARRRLTIAVVIRGAASPCTTLEVHRERVFDPQEVHRAVSAAGLVVRAVYDALTMCPARTCPTRIVVVAEKPARTRYAE
jgi:SAM-dependent methyltransferase